MTSTKGTVFFFFPRKSLGGTHSLTLGTFRFFFFPCFGKKKKQAFFFFFPGKVCKPLTQLRDGKPPKKGQKRTKTAPFVQFQIFSLLFFFFPKIWIKILFFFFSQEKFTRHSLTRFQRAEKKKNSAGKKKNTIFTHSLVFSRKVANFKLFRVKKKIRYLWPDIKQKEIKLGPHKEPLKMVHLRGIKTFRGSKMSKNQR